MTIANTLEREGVEHRFALAGKDNMAVANGLEDEYKR